MQSIPLTSQRQFSPAANLPTCWRKKYCQCACEGECTFRLGGAAPDGTPVPIEVFLSPIQLGGRQLIQALCNDITVRKRAEEELRRVKHGCEKARRVSAPLFAPVRS